MATSTHPERLAELSVDQLKSLERDIRHERGRRSVEYAVATATQWAIDDEAHQQGACLHTGPISCSSLVHEEEDSTHRWQQDHNRQEWRCARCHLWLIGLPKRGKRVYEAIYTDHDFSPYVASGVVRGGRDLLFSKCDPAQSRRLLAAAAREHLAGYERQEQRQPVGGRA